MSPAANAPELSQWIAGIRGQRMDRPLRSPRPLPAHVGLWLDRCLLPPDDRPAEQRHARQESDEQGNPERHALYETAVEALRLDSPTIAAYRGVFERWRRTFTAPVLGIARWSAYARTTSRLHLHPATGATVTEGGLLLHHTYGVPYIPGSALKGLARRRVREAAGQIAPGVLEALFGAQRKSEDDDSVDDQGGMIEFLDALWCPVGERDFSPLALDIVNPHHAAYYRDQGESLPGETEDPIPTEFPTVRPNTVFFLVLEGPDFGAGLGRDWVRWVGDEVLLPALRDLGVGAHTAAGYGRLSRVEETSEKAQKPKGPPPSGASELATVVYRKGNRMLQASFAGGGKGEVSGDEADRMLDTLPEGAKKRLRAGSEVRLMATWTLVGNRRRLVHLQER